MRKEMQTVRQLVLSTTIITVLFTCGILHPLAAHAATYYVATTGNDANPGTQAQPFRTIARGITSLAAGDTLYLRGGTYPEGINSNSQSIPGGTSWGNATTIASFGGETAIIAGNVGNGDLINLPNDTDHYIIFDRIVFDGSQARSTISVGAGGAHHLRFQDCEVRNNRGSLVDPESGSAVYFFGSYHEILRCKVYNTQQSHGIYASQGHDYLIEGNEIYNNAGYGIQIHSDSFPSCSTCSVDNVIVRNNRLYNNNYIRQWGGAIVVGRGSNCLVYNNLIYSNNGGIDLQRNAKNEQIYNNTIYNNKSGISIPFDTAIGTIIKNNIIYQNSTTISDNGAGTIQSNNLMTDPKFVNALTNDFILQATSPAIDAGITLSTVATDLNGIARPQGVRYDIGAHEYPTSQPAPPPAPKNLKTISVTP